jgi:hypothetical protein
MDQDSSRRKWRVFLVVEAALVVAAYVSLRLVIDWHIRGAIWTSTVLSTWLVITLPVDFLYLLGRPPVMSLAPFDSPECRAFRRELRARQVLEDDEFFERFYLRSGISPDVVARVRSCVVEWDPLARRAVPGDNLALLNGDLDIADVLHWIGREFAIGFTRADYPALDGTLDNLIRLVHDRLPAARQ